MSEGRKFRYCFWTKAGMWLGAAGTITALGVIELTPHIFLGVAIVMLSLALLWTGVMWLEFFKDYERLEEELENDCYEYVEENWEDDEWSN